MKKYIIDEVKDLSKRVKDLENNSPTIKKEKRECDCRCHGTPYARYDVYCIHCQPSEEKGNKKGYYMSEEGYYNKKGQLISEAEYYSFITASGTSEEEPSNQKECACHCHIDGLQEGWTHCRHCGGTKPSSSSSWEKEFDKKFVTFYGEEDEYGNTTEGETIIDVDPKEVKSFISQLLKKEREKVIEEVKKNTKDLTKYETEFTCPCGIEHSVQFLIRKPKVMKGKITEITINGEQLKK